MATSNPVSTSGLLVVEGRSDEHAIYHLCRRANPGLLESDNFHDGKSFQGVLNTIRGFVNQEAIGAVGFVVDADDAPIDHWQQVVDRIAAANDEIRLPQSPDPNGTVIPEDPAIGSPRIGIWVMPDNVSNGELEDFVRQMIPAGDPVWPSAVDYIDGIPADARKFDDDHIVKNQVHAWLAARKYPGLMGLAIREGDLNTRGQSAQTFLRWLARLFA